MNRSTLKIMCAFLLGLSTVLSSCSQPPVESQSSDSTTADTDADTKDTDASKDTGKNDQEEPSPSGLTLISSIKKDDGSKVKVACIGDSLTAGTGITDKEKDSYPARLGALLGDGYEVKNFGIGGSYILPADSPYNKRENKTLSYRDTQQHKDSLAYDPDVVLIMLGANDALSSMVTEESIAVIQSEYEKIIKIYKNLDSVKHVYVLSTTPSIQNIGAAMLMHGTLQKMQQRAAENTGCDFVNTYPLVSEYFDTMLHTSDRLHPNDKCIDVLPTAIHSIITGTECPSIKAPTAKDNVVFVSPSGSMDNDGSTPQKAVDRLPYAAGLLRESGGTIVICGDYTCYKQSGTIMPKTNGKITVTSVWNGVDYRASGARLSLTGTYLYLGGDMEFKDITIHSVAASIIVCNYHNVTFADSVTCTVPSSTAYPIILAGINVAHGAIEKEAASLTGTCNITINGGSWGYIRGGNRRQDKTSTIGEIAKDAKLTITVNGGEIKTVATQNINTISGMNSTHGDIEFVMTGGIIYGNLHAVCRIGTNSTADNAVCDGNIKIAISGGEIRGTFSANQDNSIPSSAANITLTIKKSVKDTISSITGFNNITETE